ncbi:MAG: hypothetical protein LUD26_00475 [Bacteroides uniformis]|nr:hypothetical protein [Bacteroides uniformis]
MKILLIGIWYVKSYLLHFKGANLQKNLNTRDFLRTKKYAGTILKNIRSLNTVPLFSFPELVHRSASVDVVWGNAGFPKQKTTKNAEFAKTYPLKTTLKTTNERAILLSSTNGM